MYGKKSKSKSKLKLPKEVAGVKVPKGLRKQAKTLLNLIDTPAGRELAATGLTLAAASLVAGGSVQAGERAATLDMRVPRLRGSKLAPPSALWKICGKSAPPCGRASGR